MKCSHHNLGDPGTGYDVIQTFLSVLPLPAPMNGIDLSLLTVRDLSMPTTHQLDNLDNQPASPQSAGHGTIHEIRAAKPNGSCKFCSTPTADQIAGDFICLNCYSEAGACCQGESEC